MTPLTAEDITNDLRFDVGQQYVRQEIHNVCGGNPQPGIAPITDLSAIFLFGSTVVNDYGYADKWLPDDHFLLTGVGQQGDQRWDGSVNRSLATHTEDDRRLFLFERIPHESPTVVTYIGEYDCVAHYEDQIPDIDGNRRTAYRFELRPVGDAIDTDGDTTPDSLYERAVTAEPGSPSSSRSETYVTSTLVRQYALHVADGVCGGCDEPAPFETESGDPYLEVHHITRRSDNGPDRPENVIALCPNCHRRVHHGNDGDEFNESLAKRARQTTREYRNGTT
jgi:HNH endonuclease.